MAFREYPPSLPLDQITWDLIGEEDPATRLLAHIRIGGLDMHLEAYQVTTDANGCQTTLEHPDYHGTMAGMNDVGSFQTLEINGRDYFICALPYGA
jgi:hypothetical protein